MQYTQTLAAHALGRVLAGEKLTDTYQNLIRSTPDLLPAQRAQLMDLLYGTLRHYGWLRAALNHLVPQALNEVWVDRLLLIACYQLRHTQATPYTVVDQAVRAVEVQCVRLKGLANGVLRNFLRRQDELKVQLQRDSVAYWNHPEWWIGAIQSAYPKAWKDVLAVSNQHPPMTLRVNTRQVTVADYLLQLHEAGVEAQALGEEAVLLTHAVPVDRLPGFFEGLSSVQDAGAQYAAAWLEASEGMRALDACAAPGGKTGHLLERIALDMTALDNDARRLQRVEENLARLQLTARLVHADALQPAAWWDGVPFDRILADVPCSASGVVRRQPDIKWTRTAEHVRALVRTQASLLDALWTMLASGGKMLYATCSVFPAENRKQIDAFLQRTAQGTLERDLQLLPTAQHDGFYYALLRKN